MDWLLPGSTLIVFLVLYTLVLTTAFIAVCVAKRTFKEKIISFLLVLLIPVPGSLFVLVNISRKPNRTY